MHGGGLESNMQKEIYIPDGADTDAALERTTHLCISAHQDDIEIMAYSGILDCFGRDDKWFAGAVMTNGSGSPRSGIYESYTNDRMMEVRRREQKKAACVGEYGAQVLYEFSSADVKNPNETAVVAELKELIEKTKPQIIYTHNPADKHETHVAVVMRVIAALREMEYKPQKLYGCECWRNLDWMPDEDKVKFNTEGHSNLENALLGVFDSQIAGGKRYDLATAGRRLANATFSESHSVDNAASLMYAMDLTPLLNNGQSVSEYVLGYIDKFRNSAAEMIKKVSR